MTIQDFSKAYIALKNQRLFLLIDNQLNPLEINGVFLPFGFFIERYTLGKQENKFGFYVYPDKPSGRFYETCLFHLSSRKFISKFKERFCTEEHNFIFGVCDKTYHKLRVFCHESEYVKDFNFVVTKIYSFLVSFNESNDYEFDSKKLNLERVIVSEIDADGFIGILIKVNDSCRYLINSWPIFIGEKDNEQDWLGYLARYDENWIKERGPRISISRPFIIDNFQDY